MIWYSGRYQKLTWKRFGALFWMLRQVDFSWYLTFSNISIDLLRPVFPIWRVGFTGGWRRFAQLTIREHMGSCERSWACRNKWLYVSRRQNQQIRQDPYAFSGHPIQHWRRTEFQPRPRPLHSFREYECKPIEVNVEWTYERAAARPLPSEIPPAT